MAGKMIAGLFPPSLNGPLNSSAVRTLIKATNTTTSEAGLEVLSSIVTLHSTLAAVIQWVGLLLLGFIFLDIWGNPVYKKPMFRAFLVVFFGDFVSIVAFLPFYTKTVVNDSANFFLTSDESMEKFCFTVSIFGMIGPIISVTGLFGITYVLYQTVYLASKLRLPSLSNCLRKSLVLKCSAVPFCVFLLLLSVSFKDIGSYRGLYCGWKNLHIGTIIVVVFFSCVGFACCIGLCFLSYRRMQRHLKLMCRDTDIGSMTSFRASSLPSVSADSNATSRGNETHSFLAGLANRLSIRKSVSRSNAENFGESILLKARNLAARLIVVFVICWLPFLVSLTLNATPSPASLKFDATASLLWHLRFVAHFWLLVSMPAYRHKLSLQTFRKKRSEKTTEDITCEEQLANKDLGVVVVPDISATFAD
mmetsp:Transcript_17003/g.19329  ORF Transcript_17003/g.19329 Transcript_17003/m.19329 type:complete len:420 (+) Transcript_17003:257-1516(+)